jgi:hypothetical protein
MRNASDKVVEKIKKTCFMFTDFFFRKSIYLRHNVEKYGTARRATNDKKIRHMLFACWITKATDTHSEYLILITFPRQQWFRLNWSCIRSYVTLLWDVTQVSETLMASHTLEDCIYWMWYSDLEGSPVASPFWLEYGPTWKTKTGKKKCTCKHCTEILYIPELSPQVALLTEPPAHNI